MRSVDRQLYVRSLAGEQLGNAGPDPIATPVDDEHATSSRDLATQDLPSGGDLHPAIPRKVRNERLRAGGKNDCIGSFGLHQRAVYASVFDDLYARQRQLT